MKQWNRGGLSQRWDDRPTGSNILFTGSGWIKSTKTLENKIVADAGLIQVYTGFIYKGPGVVKNVVKGLAKRVEVSGEPTLAEAVAKARSGVHLMR